MGTQSRDQCGHSIVTVGASRRDGDRVCLESGVDDAEDQPVSLPVWIAVLSSFGLRARAIVS
jgi:hypothetical protein